MPRALDSCAVAVLWDPLALAQAVGIEGLPEKISALVILAGVVAWILRHWQVRYRDESARADRALDLEQKRMDLIYGPLSRGLEKQQEDSRKIDDILSTLQSFKVHLDTSTQALTRLLERHES